MRDPAEVLQGVCRKVLPPPPILTLSEWADRERVLGPEESSEPGRWRTDRIPYLKEIMDSISDPDVRTVVIMKSARVGGTEAINNAVAYFASQDPCPMLVVFPTVDLGKSWSKEKLSPMLRNTPALRGRIAEAKSRDSNNTIQMKLFPGGYIVIAGANSPNGLSSRTCRIVFMDEVDKITAAAGEFGSPIELAKKRTTTYPGRYKHILASTPGIKGESVIEAEFERGDQRRYHVECPHCTALDYLRWENVKWPDGHPEEAVYVCPHCQGEITDGDKPGMLKTVEMGGTARWVPSRKAAVSGTRSYHINELYSPWVTFGAMAVSFIQKKHQGIEAWKTFFQESLGETWDDQKDLETHVSKLVERARKSPYKIGEIPRMVALLVAAVDCQDDRLEALTLGVAPGGTRFSIEHKVFYGNLALPEVWDELEKYLLKTWDRLDGGQMKIRKVCLDTGGHYEKQVSAFTRRKSMIGVAHPIKGGSKPQKQWVAPAKRRSRLMLLDTVAIKRNVYQRLKIEDPEILGYQWFPKNIEQEYFDQLLSEHLVKTSTTWRYEPIKSGMRNEIIDLHTYCEASVVLFKPKPGELEQMLAFYEEKMPRKTEKNDEVPEVLEEKSEEFAFKKEPPPPAIPASPRSEKGRAPRPARIKRHISGW